MPPQMLFLVPVAPPRDFPRGTVQIDPIGTSTQPGRIARTCHRATTLSIRRHRCTAGHGIGTVALGTVLGAHVRETLSRTPVRARLRGELVVVVSRCSQCAAVDVVRVARDVRVSVKRAASSWSCFGGCGTRGFVERQT